MIANQGSPLAGRSEQLSVRYGRTPRAGSRLHRLASTVGTLARAALALLAGRRSGRGLPVLASAKAFQREVLEATRPVLVMFYKTGCPTCVLMLPILDQLAREYGDRAVIAKYKHYNPFLRPTSSRIMKRYRVYLVPTVILFVNGQEKRRWFMKYGVDSYRRVLDRALDTGDPNLLAPDDDSSTEPVAPLPDCCTKGGACAVKL